MSPVWEALPKSATLVLRDKPGGNRAGGCYIAVRPEGVLWHWSVVSSLHRLLGSGNVDTLELAQQAAEGASPIRVRRRLAVNAESSFR